MPFLEGQVAVVTGAARGLGAAFAHALAREGASLAVCDIDPHVANTARDLESYGGAVFAATVDVSDVGQVERFAGELDDEFGRIDLLVNNAAIWAETPVDASWEQALADYDRLVNTNSRGPWLMTRLCLPLMRRAGGGNIVNISADDVMPPRRPHTNAQTTDLYNGTRWAVSSMMRSWSLVLAEHGIRVNAICPGPTDTPGGRAMFGDSVAAWLQPDEVAGLLLDLLREGPQGRTGENLGAWPGHPVELGPRKAPHKAMTG